MIIVNQRKNPDNHKNLQEASKHVYPQMSINNVCRSGLTALMSQCHCSFTTSLLYHQIVFAAHLFHDSCLRTWTVKFARLFIITPLAGVYKLHDKCGMVHVVVLGFWVSIMHVCISNDDGRRESSKYVRFLTSLYKQNLFRLIAYNSSWLILTWHCVQCVYGKQAMKCTDDEACFPEFPICIEFFTRGLQQNLPNLPKSLT